MSRSYVPAIVVMAAMVATAFAISGSKKHEVDRGDYIANSVAMCMDCHHAHLPTRGLALRCTSLRLHGRVPCAPDLASDGFLRQWTDDDLARFLSSGITPSGDPARPGMPQYRLDDDDAAVLVAYIRSLPPAKPAK